MKNGNLKEVIKAWYEGESEPYTTANGSLYHEDGVLFSYGDHFPLAIHVGSKVLVNGDWYSKSTARHQSYLIQELSEWERVEIPFSALDNAIGENGFNYGGYNFNLKDVEQNLRVIDQKGDTWLDTGRYTEDGEKIFSHTLGACIFEYKERCFFSGIDETGLGVHKYFLTELVEKVETVGAGLEAMKPKVVKDAEAKGIEVLRQGEWFFIKSSVQNIDKPIKKYYLTTKGDNKGHHFASFGADILGLQLVQGIVKHEEHQHKQLKLYEVGTKPKDREWYEAYHNIQVNSFNAVGDVD